MNLRLITNSIISLFMVSLLVFLYIKVQSLSVNEHHEITDTLRQMSALNFQWDQEVLQTKLSLSTHYDAVASPLATLSSLQRKLVSKFGDFFTENTPLEESVESYKRLMKEKDHLIEQFKGQNAILRNSLHYISTAVQSLVSEIDTEFPSSSKPNYATSELRKASQELLRELLEFNQLSKQELIIVLDNKITEMRNKKDKYPTDISNKLEIVLNHASVIVRKKPEVDRLLADIVSLPISRHIDNIEKAYMALYDKRLHEKDFYFTILVGYASLLLLLIALIGYRLRNSYRELNSLNKKLQVANETLEDRVTQRTKELSKAYLELKQSQAQLVQSEKMASLGQMVAGVAHEINTPLAYCHSNIELIKEQLPEVVALFKKIILVSNLFNTQDNNDEIPSKGQLNNTKDQFNDIKELISDFENNGLFEEIEILLDGSISGLDQISNMVKSLKDFSRLDQQKVENSDLNKGLDSVLVIANNVLKDKVEVVKNYGEIPLVSCSPSQLNQVFLNLIVNAVQAIEKKGTIILRTFRKDNHVNVLVEDDGKGIPEDILPHIFDPFFTTKDIGQGTGLGLSIAYKIVQQHGGTITVDSEVNKGARFTVSIPVGQVINFKDLEFAT